LCCCLPAFAATESDGSFYYIESSGQEKRFVQHISWAANEAILRYEISIERQNNAGAYVPVVQKTSEETFIEVSLAHGSYRYRVRGTDLLNRVGEYSDWISFTIQEALQPSILGFSPQKFYLDTTETWNISISGKNFVPDSEIYINSKGLIKRTINPLQFIIDQSGQSGTLVFQKEQLIPGDYEFYIRNPGGLEDTRGTFSVERFLKPLDFYSSLGYSPIFPLYGNVNDTINSLVFPLGAVARFGLIPLKRTAMNVGMEIAPFWNNLTSEQSGYTLRAHTVGGRFNILVQKWMPARTMAINFRAGGGVAAIYNFQIYDNLGIDIRTSVIPEAGGGVSYLWLLGKHLFLEAGADYSHFFTQEMPGSGYFRPFADFGLQF
jgi:hypothetical protein